MATQPQLSSHILPAHSDSIRIVPLHPAIGQEIAAPASAPHLTYRNGPLIASVEIFSVLWGAAWNSAPQAAMMAEVNQFFGYIVKSPLIDQLAEYDVPGYKISHGKHLGTTVITSPVLGPSIHDSAIQHTLQNEIATNSAFPKLTPNTLYFLYFPPGVKVI
jgi:hypothetical protein